MDIRPGRLGSFPTQLTVLHEAVVFQADDGTTLDSGSGDCT